MGFDNGDKFEYLKEFYEEGAGTMPTQEKELTGYPSIDKPWLKYYGEKAIAQDIPETKMYDYVSGCCSGHKKNLCLEYFGTKITYQDFIKRIENVAKAFVAFGVVDGEIVSIVAPTTPESIYCVYALNRIGAIANLIDPRLCVENIKEKIACSKYIVALDMISDKMEKAVDEKQKIVFFSIAESFPWYMKFVYALKTMKSQLIEEKPLKWNDFIKAGSSIARIEDASYQRNKVAILVSTSGTTGKSKLAQLTNENVNAVAWQYEYAGFGKHFGDTFLNIMPLFLAYGFISGIHMPMALGFKTVIIPQRELAQMAKYILKYKPQAYLDVPNGIASVISDKRVKKNTDLSFIQYIGIGGDSLDVVLEQECNEFLKTHNCSNKVQKGYGMTEIGSAAVINASGACNTLGSVGIPFPKTIAKIVNPDTCEELGYDEIGELCLSGPGVFKGYLGDDQATSVELETDERGVCWVHTGDLFSMNENGELFFKERIKNMFVRPDGHNNHPHIINELILQHPAVYAACTVGVQSPYHAIGKYPKSVIILKEEFKGKEDKIQQELEKMCMTAFSQRDIPYYYEFLNEFPYTPNGKVDLKALEDEGISRATLAAGVVF
ncbi:MAG: AMP-binding protein [Lachnospiraceae bacterium]